MPDQRPGMKASIVLDSLDLRLDAFSLIVKDEGKKIKIRGPFFEPEIPGFIDEKAKLSFHPIKNGGTFSRRGVDLLSKPKSNVVIKRSAVKGISEENSFLSKKNKTSLLGCVLDLLITFTAILSSHPINKEDSPTIPHLVSKLVKIKMAGLPPAVRWTYSVSPEVL